MVDLVSRTFDDKRLFHMRVVSTECMRRSSKSIGERHCLYLNPELRLRVTVGHCGCLKSLLPYLRR